VRHRGLSRIHPAGGALGAFCRPAIQPRLLLFLGPAAACPCRRDDRHFSPWVADSSAGALLAPDGVGVPVWSEFARKAAAASQRLPPVYAKDKLKNFTLFNRSSVSYSEAHARSFGVRPLASSVDLLLPVLQSHLLPANHVFHFYFDLLLASECNHGSLSF